MSVELCEVGGSMELRHLRYFQAVAEELNFGRAAKRLHISQPPLSRQIHQLESELGVVLFERKAAGIALTPAGRVLLDGAREILLKVERLTRRTQRVAKGEIGKLTIGFRETAMYNGVLPAIFHAFRRQFANVELDIIPLPSIEQWTALRDGRIDVGFVYNLPQDEQLLTSEEVFDDDFLIAINQENPLARRRRLRLRDLADQPFVWFPRSASPRYHDELMIACQKAGFSPQVVQLAPYIGGTALTLVSAGVGISFAQESSAKLMKPGNVILRPLEDLRVKCRFSALWKADNSSPLLASFLAVVRRMRAVAR
jgi:DNA-binding transcriptional LysR family regulator